ncbi:MAG TPA: hypothetical protein VMM56_12605 [Planctomycetaceae bacterium]|nr:hypothetical protein [Planctomycetaceae bacterium]
MQESKRNFCAISGNRVVGLAFLRLKCRGRKGQPRLFERFSARKSAIYCVDAGLEILGSIHPDWSGSSLHAELQGANAHFLITSIWLPFLLPTREVFEMSKKHDWKS